MHKFKKVRWRNLLSTGNVWTEVNLEEHKTTLIVGHNGAGKSTFLDAVYFALFNLPFRDINKPQLVNTINKKNMVVELEFEVGSNSYLVRRGIKPYIFEVYHNDNLINQDAASKDYQETFEKQIVKMNHRTFSQVVALGAASFTPFMKLKRDQRAEIIEDVLDTKIFTTMFALHKAHMSQLSVDIQQVEYDSRLTTEKIRMQQIAHDAMQTNTQEQIQKNTQQIEVLLHQLEDARLKVNELSKTVCEEEKKLNGASKVVQKKQKLSKIDAQFDVKVSKLKSEVDFFCDNETCPTCKQLITEDFKQKTVIEKTEEIGKTTEAWSLLEAEIKKTEETISEYREIESAISTMKTTLAVQKNTAKSLISLIEDLKQDNARLLSPTGKTIYKETEDMHLEIKLEQLEAKKADLLKRQEMYKVASVLLKDIGNKIVKQYIPVINKLISKYLAAMDFFVQFELDEQFNETIKSRFRDEFSYSSFSEGEKVRINVAILFAWRAIAKLRNSASTNLLILDEMFDGSLDSLGKEEFLKIMEKISPDSNIFMISHSTDMNNDKFENVIRFEKHKNFSRKVEVA